MPKRVVDYLENAQACRELAEKMPPPHREQLLRMAAQWERIADERADALVKAKELPIRNGPRSVDD